MGSSTENSAFGPTRNPARHRQGSRWQQRWFRRSGGGWLHAARPGLRHRRLHPPAGRLVRGGRDEAHLRSRVTVRVGGLRQFARPDRPLRHDGGGRGAALRRPGRARPARQHLVAVPARADAGDRARRSGRHEGRTLSRSHRRLRARRGGTGARGGRRAGRRRRQGRGDVRPGVRLRALGLLPDRAGGGVVQPGPLRRRALRAAGRWRGRGGHEHGDPDGGLRRRGQAPDHAGDVCAVRRLLRRLLRAGPAGPHARDAGVRPGLRVVRRPPRCHRTDDRLRPRGQGGRPDGDVHERRLHHPFQPFGAPGRLGPLRHGRRRAAGRRAGAGAGAPGGACCSAWRGRSSRTHRTGWDRERGLGARRRARGALRAVDRHEALLRLPQRFRRRAEREHLPYLLGLAGLAAGAERAGGRAGDAHRSGVALRDPAVRVRPEELLLPGPGEGLSDQPVRPPAQRRRVARAPRRVPRRRDAGPHGGGHGQAHPCRGERPHQCGPARAGRLQPLGRPAGRDRERARYPHGRPGAGLRQRTARHPHGDRCLRRTDGGGVDAGGRQRLGPPRWHRRVRHPMRDQEPELAALARSGYRVRGGAPDRPPRVWWFRHPGDAALGRVGGTHGFDALQRGGQRLPLLPRAGPGAPGPRRGVAGAGAGGARC